MAWLRDFMQRLFNAALGLMLGFAEQAGVAELAELVAGVQRALSLDLVVGRGKLPVVEART